MKNITTGIELEFTGITREKAAETVAEVLNGQITRSYGVYDVRKITAPDQRVWKVVYDSGVKAQKKVNGRIVAADDKYKCELVSPKKHKNDIEIYQKIVRGLKKAGAMVNQKGGLHIHLGNEGHTVKTLVNFINLFAARGDLFYKALQVEPERVAYYKK